MLLNATPLHNTFLKFLIMNKKKKRRVVKYSMRLPIIFACFQRTFYDTLRSIHSLYAHLWTFYDCCLAYSGRDYDLDRSKN